MNYNNLPQDLPKPIDDGQADHLQGLQIPQISLFSTTQQWVNLHELSGLSVIYIYPMTGKPGVQLPKGWNEIPGARGCTPQSCGFRNNHQEFAALKANVFGLSTQTTQYQQQLHKRLELPFPILSDKELQLKKSINLPTIHVQGMQLYKRITLIVSNNKIAKVFYPIFPPDKHADQVLYWLKTNKQ